MRVRKVKIKLPREMWSGTADTARKGMLRAWGGSRRITLSCAINFKNKMAIGQCFCLSVRHFFVNLWCFFLSINVVLPSAKLGRCGRIRVFRIVTRAFSRIVSFYKSQETDKRVSQYRGREDAFTSKSLGHTIELVSGLATPNWEGPNEGTCGLAFVAH